MQVLKIENYDGDAIYPSIDIAAQATNIPVTLLNIILYHGGVYKWHTFTISRVELSNAERPPVVFS